MEELKVVIHGINSILVYRLGSLGDTLLALPAFHLIRRRFRDARIIALTNSPVQTKAPSLAAVLENTGLIDGVIDYPIGLRDWRKLSRLRGRIVAGRFDLAVNLAAGRTWLKSLRDYWFLRSGGIPRVVGTPWRRRDITCLIDSQTGLHEWEGVRIARRVRTLGDVRIAATDSWDLRLTPAEKDEADNLLAQHGIDRDFLAFSIGTKADTKDWTQPNWLALLSNIKTRYPQFPLVGIGAATDAPRTAECLAAWSGLAMNLCGRASIRVTAGVLRRAKLFLGHDSGPMHLAATLGVPCVAIFSVRNYPGQWFPRGENNTVLYHRTDCSGCGLDVCTRFDKKCIRAIKMEIVAAAVARHLGSPASLAS